MTIDGHKSSLAGDRLIFTQEEVKTIADTFSARPYLLEEMWRRASASSAGLVSMVDAMISREGHWVDNPLRSDSTLSFPRERPALRGLSAVASVDTVTTDVLRGLAALREDSWAALSGGGQTDGGSRWSSR